MTSSMCFGTPINEDPGPYNDEDDTLDALMANHAPQGAPRVAEEAVKDDFTNESGPSSAATGMGPSANPQETETAAEATEDITEQPLGTLEAALEFADMGLGVIPLKPGTKIPAVAGGYRRASTDPQQLRAWFGDGDNNLGVVGGEKVHFVDVDGEVGIASMAKLFGGDSPPALWTIKTPNGFHMAIPGRPGCGRYIGVLPGVDYLGDGGHVVAPPSALADGRRYTALTPVNLSQLDLFDIGPWRPLLERLSRPTSPDQHKWNSADGTEDLLAEVAEAPEGERNDTLFAQSASQLEFVLGDPSGTNDTIRRLVASGVASGLEVGEVERTVASAAQKVQGDFDLAVARAVRDKHIRARADAHFRASQRGSSQEIPIRPLSELALSREVVWSVRGVLPVGSIAILHAEPKKGKTTLALNLVHSVLTGEPFLDRFPVKKIEGTVAYINLEMNDEHFVRWANDLGIDLDRVMVVGRRGMTSLLDDPDELEKLARKMRDVRVESIIVDSAIRLVHGDENSASVVAEMLNHLAHLKHGAGASTMVITHHQGRGSGNRTRGTSEFDAFPDVLISLQSVDGVRVLSASGRDVDLEACALSFDPETRRLTALDESPTFSAQKEKELVAAFLEVIKGEPGMTQSEVISAVKVKGISFRNAKAKETLDRLEVDGAVISQKGGRAIRYFPDI